VALAALVDWDALLKVVAASLGAAVGVTLAFSLAIVGATGVTEARRNGRAGASLAFTVLAVVALLACAGAVALGIALMLSKD
jgi:hypothetical protein